MAEYIERKAAIAEIGVLIDRVKRNPYDSKEETYGVLCGLSHATQIVKEKAQAADVVEVVRCKDCIHWGGEYATNECSLITQLANPDYWLKTAPDDFCSSGERKDGKK